MDASLKTAFAVALALACAAGASGQDIARQVKQTRNGTVQIVFASKPGTCGDAATFISSAGIDDEGHQSFYQTREGWSTTYSSNADGYRHCEEGPVRVDLSVEKGEVTDIATYVGARVPQPAVKVGTYAAVDYLVSLAERGPSSVGKHALLPAMLADSVEPWPQLLRVARNQSAAREVRKTAIFWLSQGAGDKAAVGLKSMLADSDVEIRKQAVFALSQLRDDQGVDALIQVAKTSKDPAVRKSALFWLGQKNDPRVLALFEDILLKN